MKEQDIKMIFFPLKNGGKCSLYIYLYARSVGIRAADQELRMVA